ncbi:hypothetical protein [Psychromicrobium lacuslunae]|uniref:hypothetical protein n=1 Tax=Psychromicrobium lacuslunae TaxID=1618207 RepID=UPI000AE2A58B|nr:hypothetical protein [Psychromicrobium lacuslunae]
MFLPYTALDAARELAQSALPDAPVIEDSAPKPGRVRLGCARALHRLARYLEGAQRTQQSYPRQHPRGGLPEHQPSL